MGDEQVDGEALAAEVRRLAGLAPDAFVVVTDVAVAVLGEDAIVVDPELAGTTYLRHVGGRYEIVVRLDAPDLRFRLMHEVAHVAIRRAGIALGTADEERFANYVAAAVIAPRDLVKRAHAHYGERPRALAKIFGLSQTAMVLRLGEVLRDERVVVTQSGNVLMRSQGTFPWADTPVVAIARGERKARGLAKANLEGGIDAGRVSLRVR